MRSSGFQGSSGFTLVELVITIALVAIVLVIAAPSTKIMMDSNRMAGATNNLIASLNLARQLAITNNSPNITVCSTTDGLTCGFGNSWATGWIVFNDLNEDGDAGTTEIIRIQGKVSNLTMTGPSGLVQYDERGLLTEAYSFVIKPASCTGNNKRTVNLLASGLVRYDATLSAC